jgi:hypothetical protein
MDFQIYFMRTSNRGKRPIFGRRMSENRSRPVPEGAFAKQGWEPQKSRLSGPNRIPDSPFTDGQAVCSALNCERSNLRNVLPTADLGRPGTNSTYFGSL